MSEVKLIHVTPNAEAIIAYCARVSSPHQNNPEFEKLIKYLINHKHWSPLEMGNMCLEIKTSRAISAQILRHKSFSFQEFSTRYSESHEFEMYEARRQDLKNRQNSIDDLPDDTKEWFLEEQEMVWRISHNSYEQALKMGIAKEQARFLLPLNTKTKLYMNGTLRSWVHYFQVRLSNDTQLEHREIAQGAWDIFKKEFPIISNTLKELQPELFT